MGILGGRCRNKTSETSRTHQSLEDLHICSSLTSTMKQCNITLSRVRMEVKRSLALKTTQHKLFFIPSAEELPEANQVSVCHMSV